MFWLAGKLGRDRVCALVKGDVEIPSDFAGVAYTEMDDRGAWKGELLRELSAAGYTVDWAKAMA
jgi:predicted nucleotide-binding protein